MHCQDEVIRWHDGSTTPIGPHMTITFEGKDDVFMARYDQWDLLNGSIYGDTVSLMDIDHIMGIQNGHIIGIQLVYYS